MSAMCLHPVFSPLVLRFSFHGTQHVPTSIRHPFLLPSIDSEGNDMPLHGLHQAFASQEAILVLLAVGQAQSSTTRYLTTIARSFRSVLIICHGFSEHAHIELETPTNKASSVSESRNRMSLAKSYLMHTVLVLPSPDLPTSSLRMSH